MKKVALIALPAFLLGCFVGAAGWYLLSPLFIDRVVSEELPGELSVVEVARGDFSDADAVHRGKGTAQLLRTADGSHLIRLNDFEVTNGPDLEVWLVADANPASSDAVKQSETASLGRLKGNIGDQTYPVLDTIDPADFGSVVIWCQRFNVLFSPATLESVDP